MGYMQGGLQDNNKEEYSIYVYHFPQDIEAGYTDWEKKRTTHSKYRALRMARKYHESADYQRVEVKCKAFSSKYACNIDKTYKVLECERKPFTGEQVAFLMALGLAFAVGIASLALFLF